MGKAASLANIGAMADTAIGYRDKIINGNFDIWQRGTANGSTDSAGFLADRFRRAVGGSTLSQSRQAFALGQTAVPGEPTYYWEGVCTSSAGSSNYAQLIQPIESVRTLAGQKVTISFYAKADASKNMAVELRQYFGTSGSPSTAVDGIGATKVALTTSWQKFTVTTDMPSISGKTLSTSGDDAVWLTFWFDAGSSFNSRTVSLGQQSGTFSIAKVRLEPGPVAQEFEPRPAQVELALCQRYFESSNAEGVLAYMPFACYTATDLYGSFFYRVTKRATPTVTILQTGWNAYSNGGTKTVTSVTNDGIGVNNVAVDIIGTGWSAGNSGFARNTSTNAILISAEL
jgi:hypothetical protein